MVRVGFAQLPRAGYLNDIVDDPDFDDTVSDFTVVGYGVFTFENGYNPAFRFNYLQKLIEFNGQATENSVKFSSSWGNGGAACFGVSGGPTFWNKDTDFVVFSLVSVGSMQCGGNSKSNRLDVPDALDFLNEELEKI